MRSLQTEILEALIGQMDAIGLFIMLVVTSIASFQVVQRLLASRSLRQRLVYSLTALLALRVLHYVVVSLLAQLT